MILSTHSDTWPQFPATWNHDAIHAAIALGESGVRRGPTAWSVRRPSTRRWPRTARVPGRWPEMVTAARGARAV